MRHLLPILLLPFAATAGAAPFPGGPSPEVPSRVAVGQIGGQNVILVSGPILAETESAFSIALTRAGQRPRVFLDSPGGLVMAGLAIGRLIRANGLETVVPEGAGCFSSCGLIWLAGRERWVAANARIGFHAASTRTARTRGAGRVSSSGNAVVGGYLNQLGMSDFQIAMLTAASPARMLELNALRPDQLAQLGIAYRTGMPGPAPSPPARPGPGAGRAPPQPQAAPGASSLPGLWEGQFRCGRDIHEARLFVWTEGTGFRASFEYGPSRESPHLQHAAYQMRGHALPDGRIGFQPDPVHLPTGQAALGLAARIEEGSLRADVSGRRCAGATLQRAR